MQIFYLRGFARPVCACRQLNTLVSVQAWHTIVRAFSACSETKWFVSVAFFSSAASTRSMFGSRSLVVSSENTVCKVIHAFLATCDLKLSVYFTTLLMHSLPAVPLEAASRCLWNSAIRLTTFRLSNTVYQSSDLRLSMLCLNCNSGFRRGSSGAL